MAWSIHHVSLATHNLHQAQNFFGALVGLGEPILHTKQSLFFGHQGRGLYVQKPAGGLAMQEKALLGPVGARHIGIAVDNLGAVITNLDKAAHPYSEAPPELFGCPAIYTLDPAKNVVVFCQEQAQEGAVSWQEACGWGIHHVNLQAHDVREAIAFYTEIAGMPEATWEVPATMGDFSIDPSILALLPIGPGNRGIHLNRPDHGFAQRNGFIHNPTIGGHPAFYVADVRAVKARLEVDGWLVTDAGVYAMPQMHQIYVFDPSTNMIEVNQFVS